ncbi:hypothetical protein RJ639_010488 [Escallonia herrerae]|uniref:Ternary complex factor MIP1 leucine-zipper domain-containing protein n=1 Tax=Escallonia herrerae TaxID=1293975 RepID=A0AA88VKT1_9ASTE|nr:hypothetical protein RJ639_010488 [Escallonia herrerae]
MLPVGMELLLSHAAFEYTDSSTSFSNSETQLTNAREIGEDNSSLEVHNWIVLFGVTNDRGNFARCGSSYGSSCSNTYRFSLEQDVRKLQQQLQEEMELHAILENAIKKNDEELLSQSCLPHQVRWRLESWKETSVVICYAFVSDIVESSREQLRP